jgi:hypothetical protein
MWLVLLIAMVARRCGLVPVYMAVGPREALSVLGRKPDGRRRVRLGVGEKKETFSPDNNTYGYELTTDPNVLLQPRHHPRARVRRLAPPSRARQRRRLRLQCQANIVTALTSYTLSAFQPDIV